MAFDWGEGRPAGSRVPADGFSARLTRRFAVTETRRLGLAVAGRGGVRLWADDALLVDLRTARDVAEVVEIVLAPGDHRLTAEYHDTAGAAALSIQEQILSYVPTPTPRPAAVPPSPTPTAQRRFDILLPSVHRGATR